ncbi:leucine-rich repeat protein, partial [Ruminococcus champanellensis]
MNRFKRLLAAACAGMLTLCALPGLGSWAEDAAEDSFSDEVLTYTKLGDGKVSVTACDINTATLHVPAEINGFAVTEIGNEAFSNCTALTEIVLPDSIETIGEAAFYNCSSLTSV